MEDEDSFIISCRVSEVHVGDMPSVGNKVIGDIPLLEDMNDENVFMISCQGIEANTRHPPSAGDVKIEETETLALIDTGPP